MESKLMLKNQFLDVKEFSSIITTLPDGQWHHVLAESNRADSKLAIYIDGKEAARAEGLNGSVSLEKPAPPPASRPSRRSSSRNSPGKPSSNTRSAR